MATVALLDMFSVLALVLGALFLSLIAVLIDRINFPQRRFRPKQIRTGKRGAIRDRTGAHIVEVPADEF